MRKLLLGAALALAVPTVAHAVEGPVPEVPYDCSRHWFESGRGGYAYCLHGPGWYRARGRCRHVINGNLLISIGPYVRSYIDVSAVWCPNGYKLRRIRIQRIPEVDFNSLGEAA